MIHTAHNLTHLWLLTLGAERGALTAGLARMNLALGSRTKHGRVADWAKGRRVPDPNTAAWMLAEVMPQVLKEVMASQRLVPVLAVCLSPVGAWVASAPRPEPSAQSQDQTAALPDAAPPVHPPA